MSHSKRSVCSGSLSWFRRLMMAGLGILLLSIPAVAVRLTPDVRGYGTHQQLGLPECTFRSITGINCPQCGITTSVCWAVRGQLGPALRSNPAGVLLVVVLCFLIPWSFAVSVSGRWLIVNDPVPWLIHGLLALLCISVLIWLVRMIHIQLIP